MGEVKDDFSIEKDNTCWVFISDSLEVRHVYDVVHSVSVLHARGVNNDSIRFFTDDPQAGQYTFAFGCPMPLSIQSLSHELRGLQGFKNLFVVVTGHGGVSGIGHSSVKVPPDLLVSAVRSAPGVELVVMALTQCFSGVFNFIDARSRPPIVMFGASNLSSTLSTHISLGSNPIVVGGVSLSGWVANSFMFYLFRWLLAPRDIDGDGRVTLLDAYKYAGASAVSEISGVKPYIFMESQRLAAEFQRIQNEIGSGVLPNDPKSQLMLHSTMTSLGTLVSNLHTSQEAWLLHADLARKLRVF